MAGRYGDDDADEDALPWLEPAEPEDEEEPGGFPYRGLIVAGVAIAAAVALLWIAAELFLSDREPERTASGEVPLIQAPEGPYKVRPDDPGGLDVNADSLTHAVAEGQNPGSEIDLEVLNEEPVPVGPGPAGTASAPPPSPEDILPRTTAPAAPAAPAAQPKPAVPAPATPAPKVAAPPPAAPKAESAKPAAPASGPVTIQLGAFGSTDGAEQVWSRLSGRVSALGGLRKTVQPVETGGRTLYRLRAGGIASEADAKALCAAVQTAGEQCVLVR